MKSAELSSFTVLYQQFSPLIYFNVADKYQTDLSTDKKNLQLLKCRFIEAKRSRATAELEIKMVLLAKSNQLRKERKENLAYLCSLYSVICPPIGSLRSYYGRRRRKHRLKTEFIFYLRISGYS